jgi:hypothetical protein
VIQKKETNPGKTQEEIVIQTIISGLSTSPLENPALFHRRYHGEEQIHIF